MTEAFHYPGYVIRLQKECKYRQKLKNCTKNYARKWCPPNQLKIRLITKNRKKNLRLHSKEVKNLQIKWRPLLWYFEKKKILQKRGKCAKITKTGFMKTGCCKKKYHSRKQKSLWRAKCNLTDKWCEFYMEMLSCNLTEIKLADLKNLSFFY